MLAAYIGTYSRPKPRTWRAAPCRTNGCGIVQGGRCSGNRRVKARSARAAYSASCRFTKSTSSRCLSRPRTTTGPYATAKVCLQLMDGSCPLLNNIMDCKPARHGGRCTNPALGTPGAVQRRHDRRTHPEHAYCLLCTACCNSGAEAAYSLHTGRCGGESCTVGCGTAGCNVGRKVHSAASACAAAACRSAAAASRAAL